MNHEKAKEADGNFCIHGVYRKEPCADCLYEAKIATPKPDSVEEKPSGAPLSAWEEVAMDLAKENAEDAMKICKEAGVENIQQIGPKIAALEHDLGVVVSALERIADIGITTFEGEPAYNYQSAVAREALAAIERGGDGK